MEEQLFAYSLSQVEQGWTWSLWDEDGGVVAAGAAPDQSSAQRHLFEAIEQARTPVAAKPQRRAAGGRPSRRRKPSALHLPAARLASARPC